MSKTDRINPAHYHRGNPYEHQVVTRHWQLDYPCGCASKYICRAGRKPGADAIEDLQKAIRYLQIAIEWRQAQSKK